MEKEYHAELRNWKLSAWRGMILATGEIYDDKKNRFPDGYEIRTSIVNHVYNHEKELYIDTENSTYKLVMSI